MKKFITLSMALTMALCSLSYGAVINPKARRKHCKVLYKN